MNDKRIRSAVDRYSGGGYTVTRCLHEAIVAAIAPCKHAITEFLCFVSHCCDNVTRSLSTDVDTGSSSDEYDWEDVTYNAPSPITTSSNATAATATVVTAPALASCDVCLNAPRVTVALLPCGHATFCQQCIDTLIATNSHCPVCLCAISTIVRFYN